MYCKSCGAENTNTSNYCKHDGVYLNNSSITYRMADQTATFCSRCGNGLKGSNNYCHNCGNELHAYTKQKKSITKIVPPIESPIKAHGPIELAAFKVEYLKKSFIPAIISLVLLFVLSFIMVGQIKDVNTTDQLLESALGQLDVPAEIYNSLGNLTDPERIAEFEEEMEYYLDEDVDVDISKMPERFFNFSDFALLANLQNPKLLINMDMEFESEQQKVKGELAVKNGLLIWLVIPFLALFIGGVVSGRLNKNASPGEMLYHTVGIASTYALILVIVSFMPGFSYEVGLKGGANSFSLDISRSYSFFVTLVISFIIGFVFSGLGILFSTRYRKITGLLSEWLPNGEAIHQAFSTVVRGFIVLFAVLVVVIYKKVEEFITNLSFLFDVPEELLNNSYLFVVAISAQLGSYVWNLTHLAPLRLLFDSTDEGGGTITYRLFSGLKGDDDGAGLDPLYFLKEELASTDVEMYLKLAILLPVIFFLWSGYRIGVKNGKSFMNTLIYSVMYSLLMFFIATISDLGVVGEYTLEGDENETGKMMLSLGFNPFVVFLQSLIFSFVFAFGGAYLHKLIKARM